MVQAINHAVAALFPALLYTRIFIVVILGWVTAVFGDRPFALALVFLVGVLPETF